jgi:hypothetical protein
MVGFVEDKQGAVAIQVALFIPILVILLLGAYELWKVLYVQQVLNDAAYQGVRMVAMQPMGVARQGDRSSPRVPEMAERMIRRYVAQTPFIDPTLQQNPDDEQLLQVAIMYQPPQCGNPVDVYVQLAWTVGREWGTDTASEWLPFLGWTWTLTGEAHGWILCERQEDAGTY